MKKLIIAVLISAPVLWLVCSQTNNMTVKTIAEYPADNLDNIIAGDGVEFDPGVSSDGNGSLKITATNTTVRLYEINNIDIEDTRLIYQAKIKTDDFQGSVFLEMWCSFEGLGEFFSRDMQTPISGTIDWSSEETIFMLQKGQNPQNVKLNIVINGTGTVWVDDIKLTRGPLN